MSVNGPAHKGEAGVLFTPANTPADTTKIHRNQRAVIQPLTAGTPFREWRALHVPAIFDALELVDSALHGPSQLLGDDGGPRIAIGYQATATFVWTERPLWGWSNGNKVFIGDDHVAAAVRYALKLARSIRKVALAAEARQERLRAAYLAERFPEAGK